MKASNIEIPLVSERGLRYRLFEILPGALTWSILILPFILSFINPRVTVAIIIAYLLFWFLRSVALNVRVIQGYNLIKKHQKLNWTQMLEDVQAGQILKPEAKLPKWHTKHLARLAQYGSVVKAGDILNAVIIATYNESREVLEPTIQSVIDSNYDSKKIILVLAYEERGGPKVETQAKDLIDQYKKNFKHAMAVKHPDGLPNEVIGKGGNITYAGRELASYLESAKIDPIKVIVTTLDADNRPHRQYFAALSYIYAVCPDPIHISFQPVPIFTNNIWDAPAPMRVIATGNSFWNVVLSLRPHMLRNFSSHAQSMQTIIDTNYWSVRSIVEDGHQFWRTYFRYDGNHQVVPLYVPIYQDAVLARTYLKTFKMQFFQLRRWAWGASDIAYVADKGFFTKNNVPKFDLTAKFLRLLEGHVSWATAPIIIAGASRVPALLNSKDYASNQLPIITSRIVDIALIGIVGTLFLSLKLLPPKPARYKRHRSAFMVFQWALLPFTTVLYNAFSALYSQTRLMFGWYMDKFEVTEKATVTEDKRRIV